MKEERACGLCETRLHKSQTYYSEGNNYDETLYCFDGFRILENDSPIYDCYYKTEPVFYGAGPHFFGVELEVGNQKVEYLYIKHISSLDDGLELLKSVAASFCMAINIFKK